MTDEDAGGRGKNGDFWMTSFVNDPIGDIEYKCAFEMK